jgi:tetratricopeptide (TPR) repeat protein
VRLSVFAGGWTLEGAEDVASAILDQLESLVTKSLVRFAEGRFSMLETIRAYTAARLAEQGNTQELHRRHAAFFARLAAAAAPELIGRRQDDWLDVLATEDDNLRAALDWCADDPACHQLGQQIAADLAIFWYLRSRPWEAWRWLEPLIARSDPSDSTARAGALWGAGFVLTIIADERAENYLRDGLAMARRTGDGSLVARSLDVLGLLAFFGNELATAQSQLEESIRHARAAGDDWCLADALGTIGSIYPLVGKLDQGRVAAAEGLTLARSRGDLQGARMSLFGLALTERRSNHAEAALAAGQEGLEISRRLGDEFFTSYFLWLLAGVERERGNVGRAAELADEALRLAREVGVPLLLVCALEVRAAVHRDRGERKLARELLEEAETLGTASVPGTYMSEALRLLGCLDADADDRATAERHLRAALDLARAVSDPWAERRAQTDLDQLIAARGGAIIEP